MKGGRGGGGGGGGGCGRRQEQQQEQTRGTDGQVTQEDTGNIYLSFFKVSLFVSHLSLFSSQPLPPPRAHRLEKKSNQATLHAVKVRSSACQVLPQL